ncbi:MAG: hypothetical protein H6828_09600 [Planctomycetes bacterium]|nr:hypothetical protein [Planctomycetota bacterium]
MEREEEFLRYAEMITAITPPELPPEIVQALGGEVPESSLPQEDPALVAERARRQARADELASALRALMRVEQFDSLDLLEAGTLGDGWLGPVVFRVVDERGRPSGSLSADRLRLEGSAAGWTLTFVLEGGYERRGGRRVAFEGTQPDEERGGVRRIVLSQTDPAPWYEALPELFGATPPAPRLDDGRWELALVKNGLNALLGADAALGSYRLERLGGVFEDELRAVELTQRDVDGRLLQRLVADRLAIARGERGVVLTLHDGVILKGSRKHAFLDGRYRIFLPRADVPSWEAAGLPGLVPVAESSAAAAPLGLR